MSIQSNDLTVIRQELTSIRELLAANLRMQVWICIAVKPMDSDTPDEVIQISHLAESYRVEPPTWGPTPEARDQAVPEEESAWEPSR